MSVPPLPLLVLGKLRLSIASAIFDSVLTCRHAILLSIQILQTVELAQIFPDSKTFPDKPTRLSLNATLAAWEAAKSNGTFTGA